jgi:two-component system sensor histidine kinase BaeS
MSDIRKNRPPAVDGERQERTLPRILLTDAHMQELIGTMEAEDEPRLVAIEVDGATVGWLGLKKRIPSRFGPPDALLARQAKHLTLLGIAVIGLTALIAFLFSRHLLKPIQRLTRGTRELANRNFTVRIAPSTHDELGQLAQNFNEMAQTLESYEKQRRQWLSDISHELRTPLTVLRGEIETIQDGIREPSPGNLASLHMEILRISRLVDDLHLLSMTDSDSLSLDFQEIVIADVLRSSLESFGTRLNTCRIATRLDLEEIVGIVIRGDAARLGQVCLNILENICKYVESPATLAVGGYIENRVLRISFEDSGPGVPEEALPRLFDRLYRVDISRNRDSGGSGLGLSICRHIIEHHKGTIWAEKSPLGGLYIGIELPLPDHNRNAGKPNRPGKIRQRK